jgi:lipopolysaccharide transport system permease protein
MLARVTEGATAAAGGRRDQRDEGPALLDDAPVVVIGPRRGWRSLGLGELRGSADLLYFLVWRDLKVRYKQTALGIAWLLIQPLLLVGVFTFVFSVVVDVPHGDVPYPVFALAGLVTWSLFVSSLTRASGSVVGNQHLVSKVYFPRLLLPAAAVLSGVVDAAAGLVVLAAFMVVYGIVPGVEVLALPAFLLLAVVTALGVSLWLSAINVRYRDVQYAIPFLVQFAFFATPVVYPARAVPESYSWVIDFNPIAVAIGGVRWALFGADYELTWSALPSVVLVVVLLISGLAFFRRTESSFADEL